MTGVSTPPAADISNPVNESTQLRCADGPHTAEHCMALADRLCRDLAPATVLVLGADMPCLVRGLRDRGVEAIGIVASESERDGFSEDVRAHYQVRVLTGPLPRRYDLIICPALGERMPVAPMEELIGNCCGHTEDILFAAPHSDDGAAASLPPPEYWAEQFARYGFFRDMDYDATFLASGTARFRKAPKPFRGVVRVYERWLRRLDQQVRAGRVLVREQRDQLAEKETAVRDLEARLAVLDSAEREPTAAALPSSALDGHAQLIQAAGATKDRAVEVLTRIIAQQEQAVRALYKEQAETIGRIRQEQQERLRQQEERHEERWQHQQEHHQKRLQQQDVRWQHQELCLADLRDRLAQAQSQGDEVAARFTEVARSRAWQLAQRLRRLYHLAALPATWRRRFLRKCHYAWQAWRGEDRRTSLPHVAPVEQTPPLEVSVEETAPLAVSAPLPTVSAPLAVAAVPAPPELLVVAQPGEPTAPPPYGLWIAQYEPDAAALEVQRQTVLPLRPTISIVVPAYRTPLPFLVAMIESVRKQTYAHWELCIADAGSSDALLRRALEYYAWIDARIKVLFLPENGGIAENSNHARAIATGDFVTFLDHDDTLAPFALFEVARALNDHPEANILYSDEDKINAFGDQRLDPFFKPDWSPETLRSQNYVCHLAVYRRALLDALGGLRAGFEGSQDYDLILRATERTVDIIHIPKVLYHWRRHADSVAGSPEQKLYAYDSARKALQEHLDRCGIKGEVQDGKSLGTYRIAYELPRRPPVSVIIPNRDNHAILDRCIEGVLANHYPDLEILVVENNSQLPVTFEYYGYLETKPNVRVLTWQGPFNYSAVNNFAVAQARGEVLLFLNNDLETITPDWIERLLGPMMQTGAGVVGAKLYYPDNTIQHGGVILGLEGVAGHAYQWQARSYHGYFEQLMIARNVSAVTGACLLTTRRVFDEVGGFDERFTLAFNDVDFCAKVRRRGYPIVWTPHAELYHHESLTRGKDDTPEKEARSREEVELFRRKWKDLLKTGDPYFSPNLSLKSPSPTFRLRGEEDPEAAESADREAFAP